MKNCFNCKNVEGMLQWINHNYNTCYKKAGDYHGPELPFKDDENYVSEAGFCSNFKYRKGYWSECGEGEQ